MVKAIKQWVQLWNPDTQTFDKYMIGYKLVIE